ncbi:immunoglobulin-like domain-containing protein [Listeria ilorinensis]|uniref:immunoglobulin-like domain-containing protein n=1 Tax=Listeria ilorinensis TaxID=2867439 RepID=UPI001EF429F5|nr:immunoglobulin-like domain-containing protein [Listeria ilorinensis]
MQMKVKKGATSLIVGSLLFSSVFTVAVPATEVSASTSVTPVNILNGSNFSMGASSFNDWYAIYGGNQVSSMSKDSSGYFILGDDVSAKQVTNGVEFKVSNVLGTLGSLNQKLSLVKGETYKFSVDTQLNKAGVWPSEVSPEITYGVNSRIYTSETSGNKTFTFTAADTANYVVSIGARRLNGFLNGLWLNPTAVYTNLSVINTDVTPPAAPKANAVYTDTNIVSGTAEPNTTVIAETEDGQKFEGKVMENGTYSFQISRQIVGQYVKVYNKDIAGNISDPTTIQVRQGDLFQPTIDPVTNTSTSVTGTADLAVSVQVKVIKPDLSEKVYTGNTDRTGNYSIEIATPDYGDRVQVVTYATGKTSVAAETTVTDNIPPEAPTVNDIYTDTVKIEGTGTPGNKVKATLPDGTELETTVNEEGKFTFDMPAQAEGSKITFIQVKSSGLAGAETIKHVLPGDLPQPVVDEITDQSTKISGTAVANANFKIIVKDFEGSIVYQYEGTVDSTGKFSILVDKLDPSYTVTMTTSKGVQSSKPVTLNVKDITAPDAPAVNAVKESSSEVTGTAEKDAMISVKTEDGTELGTGTVDKDGKYSVTIPRQSIGTTLLITATDKAGNTSETTKITVVESEGTLSPNSYVLGDINITGTYTGDITKARLTVNGKNLSWGGSFENGKFSYYVGAGKIKAGDTVTLTGYSATDKQLSLQPIKVVNSISKGSIAPNEYKLEDTTLTGTYTGDVAKASLVVNGKTVSWGGSFANGKFSYYVGAGKIKAGDDVKIVAYTMYDEKLDEQAVKIAKSGETGSLTPTTYQLGSLYITGNYTGDITKAQLFINNKAVSIGGDFREGHFTYYVGNKIKAGDEVKLVGFSSVNEKLAEAAINITAGETSGTIAPDIYTLGNSEITGSYTGDVKKARVYINGVAQAWGGTFKDGKFNYYIGNKIKTGDTVLINAYDSNDKQLDSQSVMVMKANTEGKVTPNAYKVGENYLNGTYTGDVYTGSLSINGKIVSWGGTYKNGEFSYYVGNKIKAGDDVKFTVYDQASKQLDQQSVKVTSN